MVTGVMAKDRYQFKAGIIDGRDVAEAHVEAMINPDAKGQRYLAM